MKLLSKLLTWVAGRPSASSMLKPKASPSQNSNNSPDVVRKDLLRQVLRATLDRNGIPIEWISGDVLKTATAAQGPGLHVRFVVRHWEPLIALHTAALERDFEQRLLTFDPLAANWIRGFSWRYELPKGTELPRLPHGGSWTSMATPEPRRPLRSAALRLGEHDPIIAGPVVLGTGQVRHIPGLDDDAWAASGRAYVCGHANTEPSPLSAT
jgi:hypothetical protein